MKQAETKTQVNAGGVSSFCGAFAIGLRPRSSPGSVAFFTATLGLATLSPLRVVLFITAFWALVAEPTFGVFERLEQHPAPVQQDRGPDDSCAGLDQPVPPHEVAPVQWVNEHAQAELVLPLLDSIDLMFGRSHGWTNFQVSLPAHLSLPYPPSVAPLRL